MKKLSYIFLVFLLVSCTSNTIFEEPKDLIPKDTMSLLVQEMMIASSSKYVKNKNLQKKINYMPFVYDRFKIDSVRFQNSNYYYMSKIDLYQKIFEDAKASLEKRKSVYDRKKTRLDSIRNDSLRKARAAKLKLLKLKDSLKKEKELKNALKDSLTKPEFP